ncbi:hypothetical protein Tco_1030950 [Tanacetum coccineum]|uniref:Uncharacterized protein n=1 Tax=Tanacetum coccineum TaxID=301880 RepID=A0ABQ5G7T5_9ASTR
MLYVLRVLVDHESSSEQVKCGIGMLRWTCGKTMVDMIPNGVFRAKLDVDFIIDKMREGRLRWFRHVKRRPQTAPVRRVEALLVQWLNEKGIEEIRMLDLSGVALVMDVHDLGLRKPAFVSRVDMI